MGWAPIQINKELDDHSSCLDSAFNKAVYFVHSFQLIPDDPKHLLSSYSHNGIQITAAVQKDNVTGVQFHPEKSDKAGLKVIENFINL